MVMHWTFDSLSYIIYHPGYHARLLTAPGNRLQLTSATSAATMILTRPNQVHFFNFQIET